MRSGALLVAGLAAAAVLGWLWLMADSDRVSLDDVGIEDAGFDDAGGSIGGSGDGEGTPVSVDGGSDDGDRTAIRARASRAEGVSGRVITTEGTPVSGATVDLFEHVPNPSRLQIRLDGKALAATQTAEDGTFTVGPAPEATRLRVRAQAPKFAPGIADVAVRGGYAEIVLDRGGSLRVQVVDASGEAVGGAKAVHAADEVVTVAVAGEDGVAHFPALGTGTATLVVTAPGHRSARDAEVSIVPDEETERTMVLSAAPIVEGVVLDGETGKPITDARVSLHYPTLPTVQPEPDVSTDHEGRFRIANHAGERERMQYRIVKAGYAQARRVRSGTDTSALQFKLYRMVDAFRGVVYDTNRIPAAGVRVTYGRVSGMGDEEDPPETRTDDTGNFRLPPPPWVMRGTGYQVIALSESGEVGQRFVSAPSKTEAVAKRIEIFLVGSGQLNGRVYDADGTALEGAVVEVEPDWSQRSRTGLHWQVFQAIRDRRLLTLETVTDEQGNFLFLRLPAITYRINAKYGGEQGTSRESVTVVPGEMSQMDVTLGSGATIEGWVHDERDQPVAGAQVRAIPVGRPGVGRPRTVSTRSRSDGTFLLRGVGDGRYQVSASMVGYSSAVAKDVESGQTAIALILPQRGRLLGLVIKDGRPYQGTFRAEARLTTRRGGPIGDSGGWSAGRANRTFNTTDGTFAIQGLSGGTYTLHVSTADGMVGASVPTPVAEGGDSVRTRVELAAGAVLRGRVREQNGTALPRAWVQIWPRRNAQDNGAATTGRGRANNSGDYEVKGLGPGAYNVTVHAKGRNWSVEIDLRQGETRELDLVYETPGAVEVIVVDPDERPIADAQPELVSKSGVRIHANYQASKRDGLIQDPQDWARMQRTDGNGRVVRHHVPPGRYRVTARHADFVGSSQEVWIEVHSDRRSEARVMLRPKKDDDR